MCTGSTAHRWSLFEKIFGTPHIFYGLPPRLKNCWKSWVLSLDRRSQNRCSLSPRFLLISRLVLLRRTLFRLFLSPFTSFLSLSWRVSRCAWNRFGIVDFRLIAAVYRFVFLLPWLLFLLGLPLSSCFFLVLNVLPYASLRLFSDCFFFSSSLFFFSSSFFPQLFVKLVTGQYSSFRNTARSWFRSCLGSVCTHSKEFLDSQNNRWNVGSISEDSWRPRWWYWNIAHVSLKKRFNVTASFAVKCVLINSSRAIKKIKTKINDFFKTCFCCRDNPQSILRSFKLHHKNAYI